MNISKFWREFNFLVFACGPLLVCVIYVYHSIYVCICIELETDDVNDNDLNANNLEHDQQENNNFFHDDEVKSHKRSRRQADQYEYTPTKTRCPLLLVADYRFFQEMGGGNTKTTINYLVCMEN